MGSLTSKQAVMTAAKHKIYALGVMEYWSFREQTMMQNDPNLIELFWQVN